MLNSHVTTFKNHFLKGFEEENLELMLSMYADSLSWGGPNEGGLPLIKSDISEVISSYIDDFDNIKLNDQLYFGSSTYANNGAIFKPKLHKIGRDLDQYTYRNGSSNLLEMACRHVV